MVLIITNNNPYLSSAGVQKYIQVQDKSFCDNGINSLTIFPIVKELKFWRIRLWGCVSRVNNIRSFRTLDNKHLLMLIKENGQNIKSVFIHHLKNVNVAVLCQLLPFTCGRVVFYVHDYYSCCLSVNLLRNGKCFCGGGCLQEDKCKDCMFYAKSLKRKNELNQLFGSVEQRLNVIAPSEVSASYWSEAYPQYNKCIRVIGHQVFSGVYKGNKDVLLENEPLRIAFVGAGDFNKGIEYWKQSVNQLFQNKKLMFFHLGRSYWKNKNVKYVTVNVNSKNQDAMITALKENDIHVAVLNSVCPETYSFTFYEAFAANCYIITNKNSGNIAKEVKRYHNGFVLSDPNDLPLCLGDVKSLRKNINEFRLNGINGPLKIAPNNESVFPFSIEVDGQNTSIAILKERSLFERMVEFIYNKKYPISKMSN